MEDFTRSARRVARQIGETLRQRTDKAKEAGKEHYRAWLDMTEETIQKVAQMREQPEQQSGKAAERLQSKRRVFKGESVPAHKKVLSLFEPHTDIIFKNKNFEAP